MPSTRTARLAGATLLMAALAAGPGPAAMAAEPVSCSTPELAAIDGELLKARVAIAAGDEATLQSALTAARDGLDEIVSACWGAAASPVPGPDGPDGSPLPTIVPRELGERLTLGGYLVSHPDDLAPIDTDLLRAVERDGLAAAAVTLADSDASGELLAGPLDVAVPEGFRVISLAIGDPMAALAATGGFGSDEELPGEPAAALARLGDLIEEATADATAPIRVTGSQAIGFPDGSEGAVIEVDFTSEGGILARGRFAIRPMPNGDWALGVAVGSEATYPALADDLGAMLAAISGGAEG